MPTLYVVATPIGNLEDITLRALRILKEVGLVAAEDTRKTRHLLAVHGLKKPLVSYHDRNKELRLPYLLQQLQEKDVALVSEAGMPTISDPGYELVVAALERDIPVVPIPGPSVLTTALAVSGLPCPQFLYLGFLPRRPGERRRLLRAVAGEERTLVAFEAPHRIKETLEDMAGILGERRVAVCRELTKLHEEVFRGTLSQARKRFQEPQGEFTLVVEGKVEKDEIGPEVLLERLRALQKEGLPAKEAVTGVARDTGLPRREVYRLWLRLIR
ncbi:MAG: 16S rRNA (cytidine(1402)-2'-O)-methyltransferase [Chloroflexota bacterium]|nr:16S rRNA (cytidine(1402)-2'-O)-methyltransferase [Chloroflexota bacterium]